METLLITFKVHICCRDQTSGKMTLKMNGLLVCFASFFGWWWFGKMCLFWVGNGLMYLFECVKVMTRVWSCMMGYGLVGVMIWVWWGLNMCMMGWRYGHGGVVKWVWPLVGSWCAYSVPLISWCHESLVLWSHDIGAAVLWIMINEYQVYAVQV